LYLERVYGWYGVLVEPHDEMFQKLLNRNRRAYSINTCLSTNTTPIIVSK
jgi:hypothetical protein